jgi:hypothetical protein
MRKNGVGSRRHPKHMKPKAARRQRGPLYDKREKVALKLGSLSVYSHIREVRLSHGDVRIEDRGRPASGRRIGGWLLSWLPPCLILWRWWWTGS